MNFSQLTYIIAVDKYRSFTRAAEACNVAQSTLSREIQRLEQEFGIIIFDRSRYPVTPTMKGVDLIEQAKVLLKERDRFQSIANKKDNRPKGNFKLGVLTGLAPYLVPLFTKQISEKYPELNLEIFEVNISRMIRDFENENLDGAVTISPFPKEGFYESALFEEEFVLYVGKNHPLSGHDIIKWANIPLGDLILPGDLRSYFLEQKIDDFKRHLSVENLKNINYQNNSLETIRKIIDRNGGLTILPRLACLYMGERRLEMVKQIENPVIKRTISFVAPRGFQKVRLSKVILKEIVASIPEQHGITLNMAH